MKKIKLKDYKGECVCYIDEFKDIHIVDTYDVEYIKELSSEGNIFYGTIKEKVFEAPYWSIRNMIEDDINNKGYEDMEDRIDFNSKEFKNIVSAYEEWIKSLGTDNDAYYQDEDVIIEVE